MGQTHLGPGDSELAPDADGTALDCTLERAVELCAQAVPPVGDLEQRLLRGRAMLVLAAVDPRHVGHAEHHRTCGGRIMCRDEPQRGARCAVQLTFVSVRGVSWLGTAGIFLE